MTALTGNKSNVFSQGREVGLPVAAGEHIYENALTMLVGGYLKAGDDATGAVFAGVAKNESDNSAGSNGDLTSINRLKGTVQVAGSFAATDVGKTAYLVDDQTVQTSATTHSVACGTIIEVIDSATAVLLYDVANVLAVTISGVAVALTLDVTDLVGTDATVYRIASPVAGNITKITSVLEGHALATGDATLTSKIGATGVTNGVVTITQSGSAIGDVDSATPTAANTVAVGDVISITVGGTNDDTDAKARVTILIEL